jgi:hypothetical protein
MLFLEQHPRCAHFFTFSLDVARALLGIGSNGAHIGRRLQHFGIPFPALARQMLLNGDYFFGI